MAIATTLTTAQAADRLDELLVIDVRTPGEYATGHLPRALNVPLDRLAKALPDIELAAERRELLLVCASGARAENAWRTLAERGVAGAVLQGGTAGWAAEGRELDQPADADRRVRKVWAMERQVRVTAGGLVVLGVVLGLLVHPAFQLLSGAIGLGLVYSAVTNTCGMAAVLGRLPHNRPRGAADLNATRAALRRA